MKLRELAEKLWGQDFVEKSYHGPMHIVYEGLAGSVSLGAIVPPFSGEDKATEVHVTWREIVELEHDKQIVKRDEYTTRGRCETLLVVDGDVDREALRRIVKEATVQVCRNRLILRHTMIPA